ncbi:hypothetical protein ACIA8O_36135 [Kitasatospora sp. NPDC051853]|uniref:hypothetical protein n=1 Tax=Kitasatospora sp. NPDC051853 TaxID=3364058 RepID=UPI00378A94AF
MALNDAEHPADPHPHDGTDPGTDDSETLPCGAGLAALWEDGRPGPGHEHCPDCTAALDAQQILRSTVRAALEEDRQQADESAFLDRLMAAVRTELLPGPLVPLDRDGDDWITGSAAAAVLREAVDALPGVCAGRCRIEPLDAAARRGTARLTVRRIPPGPLLASVEVFADLSRPLPETAALVRSAVAEAAALRLGLELQQVDVTVRDLLPGEEGAR